MTSAWPGIKVVAMFLDGYYVAVVAFKGFFMLFDVTLVATGGILDYLDVLAT